MYMSGEDMHNTHVLCSLLPHSHKALAMSCRIHGALWQLSKTQGEYKVGMSCL